MSVLAYLKYPLWTAREYVVAPRRALRNTWLAFLIFWRVIYICLIRGVTRTLKRHKDDWPERTRGRYIWRVAQKFWAQWSLEKLGGQVSHSGSEHVDWSRPHIIVANHGS